MKFLCIVLYVFTVSAFIGSTLGELDCGHLGTHTSEDGGPVCEVQLEETQGDDCKATNPMDDFMTCIEYDARALEQALKSANSSEEFRNAMKRHCDHLPAISACTADANTKAEPCLNVSVSKSYKLISHNLDIAMSIGCEEDGVKIATIIEEIKNLQNSSEHRLTVETCSRGSPNLFRELDKSELSQVSTAYYRLLHAFKECYAEAGQGQSEFINLIVSTCGDILKKFKCIHPESHSEVLCKSFVNN